MKKGYGIPYYPVFLKLDGKKCVVIGGGQEEACVQLAGDRGNAFSIDAWK